MCAHEGKKNLRACGDVHLLPAIRKIPYHLDMIVAASSGTKSGALITKLSYSCSPGC